MSTPKPRPAPVISQTFFSVMACSSFGRFGSEADSSKDALPFRLFRNDMGQLRLLAVVLQLGLDEFAELGRRAGGGEGADLVDAVEHARVLHRLTHLGRHLLDDVLRRAGGRGQAGPTPRRGGGRGTRLP